MNDIQVTLTDQERDFLVQVLENSLQNHRIEEHRTRSPIYRKNVIEEEDLLTQMLTKLGNPPK